MDNKIVIGLTGFKQSGKDTVAKILFKYFLHRTKYVPKIIGMADTLKEYCAITLGTTSAFLEEHKNDLFVRRTLQAYGDFLKECEGEDYFLKNVKLVIELTEAPLSIFFITGVRFQNEADMITQGYRGIVFRVSRPGLILDDKHPSETEVEKVPASHTIFNSQTLKYLEAECEIAFNIICMRYGIVC